MKFRRYDCTTVSRMLPLHAGGDLDERHRAAVDEHLHACLNCFREFRELATLRGQLRAAADEPLPDGILDGFGDDVMARVRAGEPGPAAEAPTAPLLRMRLPRVLAAAAMVAVAGVAVTLMVEGGAFEGTSRPELPILADGTVQPPPTSGNRQAIGWPAPTVSDVAGTPTTGYPTGAMGTPASSGNPIFGNGMGGHGFASTERGLPGVIDVPPEQLLQLIRKNFSNVQIKVQHLELPTGQTQKLHMLMVPDDRLREFVEIERLRTFKPKAPGAPAPEGR